MSMANLRARLQVLTLQHLQDAHKDRSQLHAIQRASYKLDQEFKRFVAVGNLDSLQASGLVREAEVKQLREDRAAFCQAHGFAEADFDNAEPEPAPSSGPVTVIINY